MDKIAIFNSTGVKQNKGGPSGYLFNLSSGLNQIGSSLKIFTLDEESKPMRIPKVNFKTSNNQILNEMRNILYFFKRGFICKKNIDLSIHEYSVIHTHSCEDVFYLRKFVNYKGKIILTSHRPEPLYKEIIEGLKVKHKTKWKYSILKIALMKIEKLGYRESDGYIFPSTAAMEIYSEFPGFIDASENKPTEFVFTGTVKKEPDISRAEYRYKLGISEKNKVVCFIGRHNAIKGYDLLTSLSDRLKAEDIHVVCAGPNNMLASPENSHWIELGFISDPFNLINAADIVVIPNRNTYFDLIIVEILSQGRIVITSDTGGNLDIAKCTRGLILFKSGDKESLYDTIKSTFKLSDVNLDSLSQGNMDFYDSYCSVDKFANNYINAVRVLVKKILNNKG